MRVGRIYVITNSVSGKIYVGQTWMLAEQRWKAHVKSAHYSKRRPSPFHDAVKAYGKEAFTIRTVCLAFTQDCLNAAECYFIKALHAQDSAIGYNLLAGGETSPMLLQASRDKLAATITGRKRSDASIAKQLKSREGFHHSEETKAKIRASNEGKKRSQETRDRISAAAKLRVTRLWTDKQKEDQSLRLAGRKLSQETKDKIGAKSRLKIMSPEARQRISESIKKLRSERFWSTRKSQSAITSPQV